MYECAEFAEKRPGLFTLIGVSIVFSYRSNSSSCRLAANSLVSSANSCHLVSSGSALPHQHGKWSASSSDFCTVDEGEVSSLPFVMDDANDTSDGGFLTRF
jgi:hypothetical protein